MKNITRKSNFTFPCDIFHLNFPFIFSSIFHLYENICFQIERESRKLHRRDQNSDLHTNKSNCWFCWTKTPLWKVWPFVNNIISWCNLPYLSSVTIECQFTLHSHTILVHLCLPFWHSSSYSESHSLVYPRPPQPLDLG